MIITTDNESFTNACDNWSLFPYFSASTSGPILDDFDDESSGISTIITNVSHGIDIHLRHNILSCLNSLRNRHVGRVVKAPDLSSGLRRSREFEPHTWQH